MPAKPSSVVGTCALCRQSYVQLCYSDLLPKAIPRWIRFSNTLDPRWRGKPNPILITQKRAIQIDYRIAEYLLCPACEERFNKGAETALTRSDPPPLR